MGIVSGRSLSRYSRRAGASRQASTASPYTVSVGRSTTCPARNAATASPLMPAPSGPGRGLTPGTSAYDTSTGPGCGRRSSRVDSLTASPCGRGHQDPQAWSASGMAGVRPRTWLLGTAALDDPVAAGEVRGGQDVLVAEGGEAGRDFRRLAVAALEDKPGAGSKRAAGLAGDLLPDAFADDCAVGFVEADLGLEGVVLGHGDVRRVGDDEVERAGHACEKVAAPELDAAVHVGARE